MIDESQEMSPLSKIDEEILRKAIIVAYDNGCSELGDILSAWKSISTDEDILELMTDLANMGGSNKQEYNSSGGFTKFMVNIGGSESFEVFKISRLTKEDNWSNEKSRYVYDIIINKDSTESSFYANTRISFNNKTERDSIWKKVFSDLDKYSNVQFV